MNIIKDYISKNYRKSTSIRDIKYIVIHYTAGRSSYGNAAKNTRDYFNNSDRQASAHYIVDNEHIIQAVDDNDIAWHCGAKSYIHSYCRNSNSIGIEICSNLISGAASSPYSEWKFTSEELVLTKELVLYLMKKYNIPIDNVIRHYDVTGKICPAPMVNNPSEWTDFKNSLKEKENDIQTIQEAPGWAQEALEYFIGIGALNGTERGLDLSMDLIRTLVIMYKTLTKEGVIK